MASPQGVSSGAWGLFARTREIARFGQLYLRKGVWNGRQLIPAIWVEEATARQTANGSSPTSDWDQGYGYQFWRSRHNSYRGDGAFGQFCMVLPDYDAVVAITSGVRSMQSVMNLVWEMLLPAMKAEPLPVNDEAHGHLKEKLAGLTMTLQPGEPTAALAPQVSGKWYEFPENDRGVQAVAFDFGSSEPALLVRTASGETRTPVGIASWAKSRGGFANGIDHFLGVPAHPKIAASGGWTSSEVFAVKLVPYETPYYSILQFRFEGNTLRIESEHNVAFGPTKQSPLVGRLRID